MYRPAEIGDLQFTVEADQNVLRLDIAMYDVLVVTELECVDHLQDVLWWFEDRSGGDAREVSRQSIRGEIKKEVCGVCKSVCYLSGLFVTEATLFLEHLVEFTLWSELENQIDPSLVVEVAEESENVRMLEMRLYLDLSTQLMLYVVLD